MKYISVKLTERRKIPGLTLLPGVYTFIEAEARQMLANWPNVCTEIDLTAKPAKKAPAAPITLDELAVEVLGDKIAEDIDLMEAEEPTKKKTKASKSKSAKK